VFAAAEVARHAQGLRVCIDDDDRVDAILVTAAAVIFDGLAGAVLARRAHRTRICWIQRLPPNTTLTDYLIRPASLDDIPHIVEHREQMFRDMGIAARFDGMATAMEAWLREAMPSKTYLGWVALANDAVVAGGGLIVIPWPPGPITMDARCGFVFNVFTQPAHRKHGLARQLMEAMHEHCRAHGIERVVLNASAFGKSLYDSMGYVVTNEPMMRMKL
jgi:GNAT superfamily N-acetyltransferase